MSGLVTYGLSDQVQRDFRVRRLFRRQVMLTNRLFMCFEVGPYESLKVNENICQLKERADRVDADFPLSCWMTVGPRLGGDGPACQPQQIRLDIRNVSRARQEAR
jgi:hypothetical protein